MLVIIIITCEKNRRKNAYKFFQGKDANTMQKQYSEAARIRKCHKLVYPTNDRLGWIDVIKPQAARARLLLRMP